MDNNQMMSNDTGQQQNSQSQGQNGNQQVQQNVPTNGTQQQMQNAGNIQNGQSEMVNNANSYNNEGNGYTNQNNSIISDYGWFVIAFIVVAGIFILEAMGYGPDDVFSIFKS